MTRSVLTALAAVSIVIGMAGCAEDEPDGAEVRFIHSIVDIGRLEILVDGDVALRLSPGELSDPVRIEPGLRSIALRSQGATSPLMTKSMQLSVQGYLIAFTGSLSNASLDMLTVDNPVPDIQRGRAAVEVVNLYEGRYQFDVYVDTVKIAADVDFGSTTDFQQVPAAMGIIKVYNAGDIPGTSLPVASLEHRFEEGEAIMVLLENGAAQDVAISVITVR